MRRCAPVAASFRLSMLREMLGRGLLCRAHQRLARVLWNEPATGALCHDEAGYEIALDCAREHGLNLSGILT